MPRITFPDGNAKDFPDGITPMEIAKSISDGLARKTVAAKFNGALVGYDMEIHEDGDIKLLTDKDEEALDVLRHTSAHALAQAVKRHRPDAQLGFGPAIEDGFYYDFLVDEPFTPEDLEVFEKEMKKVGKDAFDSERKVLDKEGSVALLQELGEEMKIPHLDELEGETLSFYTQGEFTDLCRGPHLPNTKFIKHVKLLSTSGAYWKGDEKNPMLQRIYGTAWWSKEDLDNYLHMLEEAKARDHRKIGKEMDLFYFTEEAGAGLAIFKPKGAMVLNLLKRFVEQELQQRGYQVVQTPHMFRQELFDTSGHTSHYRENMFLAAHEDENQNYVIKPMNCPGHILIYKSELRSYRDLPLRLFEFGTCYRYERSGVLHGLTRVRSLTIDDAHHFCTPDQLQGEIIDLLDFAKFVFDVFGYDIKVKLATKPADSIGSDENWEKATLALKNALDATGWDFEYDEGGGAFYGPKIDIFVKDAIGRTWQHSTIQCDFNLPERFELEYVDEHSGRQRPHMVHRAILGSLERFLGVYIEHIAGNFPMWLSPEQMRVLPVSDKTNDYADVVTAKLKAAGFRASTDHRNEKVGFKIRDGKLQKVPYLLIVGPKEAEDGTVSVNERSVGETGSVSLDEFITKTIPETKLPSSEVVAATR
jgi:threonyl-tRNA synthetase